MEKAAFVTRGEQLKHIRAKDYQRLYYGNEFCERLIPPENDLRKAVFFAQKNNLRFSFVTPYVTNRGLEKLKKLFRILSSSGGHCEVIINDWGVLRLLRISYLSLRPVLGRLLVKQKRSPELRKLLKRETRICFIKDAADPKKKVLGVQKKFPPALDYYYKGSNAASVPIIHNFLLKKGVGRIELDNVEQGLFLQLPRDKISASVYFPYVYITTSFFCPSAGCDKKKHSYLKIRPCNRQCRKYVFELRHRTFPKVIYLKGNTQFYKNNILDINKMARMGVDRIVHEIGIPV